MKKVFMILGIGIVVVLIVVSVIIGFYLGPIVKMTIEQVGSKVTQVAVKVDGVDVSLLTASSSVKGLVIDNPPGYNAPQAISVGAIAVSVDPFSVTSSKILIHSIDIQSPEITFEGGLTGNNLNKIISNVNGAPKEGNSSTNEVNNKPSPKIEVDDLKITGAKVQWQLPGVGAKTIPLPDIHLSNLGKGNDGITPAELASDILKSITTSTLKAVAGSMGDLSKEVKSLGTNTLSTVTNTLGGLLGK